MIRLFHGTSVENATKILAGGFRDHVGTYGLSRLHRGVFLSNVKLDENEGACSEAYLIVELPAELDLARWEWVQEGLGYREWLIPARVLNRLARVSRAPVDE